MVPKWVLITSIFWFKQINRFAHNTCNQSKRRVTYISNQYIEFQNLQKMSPSENVEIVNENSRLIIATGLFRRRCSFLNIYDLHSIQVGILTYQ